MTSRRLMTRNLITILSLAGLVVLFTTQTFAKEITVRGRLQKTIEAGGWVISSTDQKYLVLNARRFQNKKWFVEGTEVEATGETKPDVMATHMEGTPFEVRTMRPFRTGRSGHFMGNCAVSSIVRFSLTTRRLAFEAFAISRMLWLPS